MKEFIDITYGEHERNTLNIYIPSNSLEKTVVFFHGGGLEAGDKTSSIEFLRELVGSGITIIAANYRLYPNAAFPDFLEDGANAVKWALENSDKYGYSKHIYIMGSSAGAFISGMLCFDNSYFSKNSIALNDIKGFILHSPQPTTHFNVLRERGLDTRKIVIDDAAILNYVEEKQYPNLLLISYKDDIFCRLEQMNMFSRTLEAYTIPHNYLVLEGSHCSAEVEKTNGKFRLVKPVIDFMFNN